MKTFDFLDQIYLKRMFLVENGKVNVLNIWISLGTEFHLKLTSLMFWIKSSQKGISCLKQKSEHHHWILHIRISLGTKFRLNLTTLFCLTRFAQKGSIQSKTEKSHLSAHSWPLLTILHFSTRGPTDTSRSSRRDNKFN